VLAPHVRLGRWQEEGGDKGEARLTSQGAPLCPCYVYIGRTNGLLSHRPISNPNPSWINILLAFKTYCDDGLLGISPTIFSLIQIHDFRTGWLVVGAQTTISSPSRRKLERRHPRSRSWADTGHDMMLRRKPDSPGRSSTPLYCAPYRHT
jgi:hypothetical protein